MWTVAAMAVDVPLVHNVENTGVNCTPWFMPALRDNFSGRVDKLPYDHHELIAMIAPRAFLALGNDIQWWRTNPVMFRVLLLP